MWRISISRRARRLAWSGEEERPTSTTALLAIRERRLDLGTGREAASRHRDRGIRVHTIRFASAGRTGAKLRGQTPLAPHVRLPRSESGSHYADGGRPTPISVSNSSASAACASYYRADGPWAIPRRKPARASESKPTVWHSWCAARLENVKDFTELAPSQKRVAPVGREESRVYALRHRPTQRPVLKRSLQIAETCRRRAALSLACQSVELPSQRSLGHSLAPFSPMGPHLLRAGFIRRRPWRHTSAGRPPTTQIHQRDFPFHHQEFPTFRPRKLKPAWSPSCPRPCMGPAPADLSMPHPATFGEFLP